MAKKSKTQRAKASAARQQRKADRDVVEDIDETTEDGSEETGKTASSKSASSKEADSAKSEKAIKKDEKKPAKKNRFQFFKDVRSEMKRVTWPTRLDVLRWSGVVVAALLFFGIFVAVLDNLIITPLLVFISGL